MRHIIITQVANQVDANAWWKSNIDPEGGDTFTSALQSGSNPAITHYWASMELTEEQAQLMPDFLIEAPGSMVEEWDYDTDPGKPWRLLSELGLQAYSPPE